MLKHRLVAHRGYPRKYPENTLLGIEQAVAAGATHIEIDVQFTSDLQPVIYHDQSLVRVSGSAGYIHQMGAEEVLALPAFEPFRLGEAFRHIRISHLSDLVVYLQSNPQLTVFVELKKEAIAFAGKQQAYDRVSHILNKVTDQIVIISFDQDFIHYCRERGWPRVGVVLSSWGQLHDPSLKQIDADYLFANVDDIPPDAELSSLKPLLVVYEIGSTEEAIRLFNSGVDMIETFDIGGMMSELGCHSI